jgi:hypothetical protein
MMMMVRFTMGRRCEAGRFRHRLTLRARSLSSPCLPRIYDTVGQSPSMPTMRSIYCRHHGIMSRLTSRPLNRVPRFHSPVPSLVRAQPSRPNGTL